MIKIASGIYMIKNLISDKKYIGLSRDLKSRKAVHLYDLKNNKHSNIYLQRAWNKHGEDVFSFKIVELCSEDVLGSKEKHYIEKYRTTDRDYGYNFTHGGEVGYEYTDDIIENMRLAQESKPILQIDIDGEVVDEWYGCREASKKLNISQSSIQFCCSGKQKNRLYSGFVWVYKDDYESGKVDLKKLIQNARDSINKSVVVQLDLDFKYIKEWKNAEEVNDLLMLDSSSIRKCCKGELATVGGYRWVIKYNYLKGVIPCKNKTPKLSRKVGQYSLQLELLNVYDSVTEASRITGHLNQNIHYCCSHGGTIGGYFWRFI